MSISSQSPPRAVLATWITQAQFTKRVSHLQSAIARRALRARDRCLLASAVAALALAMERETRR